MSGSGADSGHPRPAEALAKAELARKIGAIIERRGLTQAVAAEILEVDQPKVSALKRSPDFDTILKVMAALGLRLHRRTGPQLSSCHRVPY